MYFLFYKSTVVTYLVTFLAFAVVTVQLLEPGHLDEDGPITTVCENKRFSSFFANALLKFNIQLCNLISQETALKFMNVVGLLAKKS